MSKVAVIGIAGNSVFMPVNRFHEGGETVEALSLHSEPGGKGFNQAIAAARAGSQVAFLASVGEDCPASVYDILKSSNVDAHLIVKKGNTAFASIITDKDGNNRVTVFQGVQLSASDVEAFADEIRSADVLLINNEVPAEVNQAAVKIAKEAEKIIVLNPAPVREMSEDFLSCITYFTPNEFEMTGLEKYRNIVQTRGKDGCFIKQGGFTVAPIGVKAMDTTGAGDTFNGYMASFLAEKHSLRTAVHYANIASGLSVTKSGAVSSIPWIDEVKKFGSGKIRCVSDEHETLREGIEYRKIIFENSLGQSIPVHAVEMKSDCGAELRVEAAPQGERRILPKHREILSQKGYDVVCITNAGYFQLAAKTYLSHGIQAVDGVVYSLPSMKKPQNTNCWFGVTKDGKLVISDTEGYYGKYEGNVLHAVCGGPILIQDGETVCSPRDIIPEPRTFTGITSDGSFIIAVADGRSVSAAGLSYTEEADVLRYIDGNVTEAINLDGGGSSAMLIEENESYKLVNVNSDGDYRPIADTIAIVINREK